MLYIVNIELIEDYYMGETIKTEINHIVEADDYDNAKYKIEKHYELKDNEYYLTHYVNFGYVNKLIK